MHILTHSLVSSFSLSFSFILKTQIHQAVLFSNTSKINQHNVQQHAKYRWKINDIYNTHTSLTCTLNSTAINFIHIHATGQSVSRFSHSNQKNCLQIKTLLWHVLSTSNQNSWQAYRIFGTVINMKTQTQTHVRVV